MSSPLRELVDVHEHDVVAVVHAGHDGALHWLVDGHRPSAGPGAWLETEEQA